MKAEEDDEGGMEQIEEEEEGGMTQSENSGECCNT